MKTEVYNKYVNEFWDVPINERDDVAKDFLYTLIEDVEKCAKLTPILVKPSVISLYNQWKRFCKDTAREHEDDPELLECYREALFGSAIISLNGGPGKKFVKHNRILWSHDGVELLDSWFSEMLPHLEL